MECCMVCERIDQIKIGKNLFWNRQDLFGN